MSDEIDLQLYLAALRRRWWIILLVILLASVSTFALGARQPKRYQATATLLSQAPRYQWRFDASISPIIDVRRDYQRELLSISKSSEIVQETAERLASSGQVPGISPADLEAAVSVRAGDGQTLLVTAVMAEPQQAADTANAWAQTFIQASQKVYGVSSDLASFRTELEEARKRLQALDERQVQVWARTGLYATDDTPQGEAILSRLQQELIVRNQRLADYESDLSTLHYLQQLLDQAATGQDLSQLPWELLEGPVISQRGLLSPEIARRNLDDLAQLQALLAQEGQSLAATRDHLVEEFQQVQAQLADEWQLNDSVSRERSLARETYDLLMRKVDEASIQERIDPGQLIVIAQATAPATFVRTRQLAQLAVSGVIGLIAGVLIALWVDPRWRRDLTN